MTKGNNGEKWSRILIGGLFLLAAVVGLMPSIVIGDSGYAILDLLNHQVEDKLVGLFPYLADNQSAVDNIVRSLTIYSILNIVVPAIVVILMVVLRGGNAMLAAVLGLFASFTVRFLLITKIYEQSRSLATDAGTNAFSSDPLITGIWAGIHLLIAGLIAWRLLAGRRAETKKAVFKPSPEVIDETVTKGRGYMTGGFFGAVAGLGGEYRGKAYPLRAGEIIRIGNTVDNDVVIPAGESPDYSCLISYDEALEEYNVKISQQAVLSLKSGQPLGAGRTYCLPRGTEIAFGDRSNRFELL